MTDTSISVRIRTGRRELSRLLNPKRETFSAERGVRREQPKRAPGVSARQAKKLRGKGVPNPTVALEWFRAWEAAQEAARETAATEEEKKKVKDYAYFSRRGRKQVRA